MTAAAECTQNATAAQCTQRTQRQQPQGEVQQLTHATHLTARALLLCPACCSAWLSCSRLFPNQASLASQRHILMRSIHRPHDSIFSALRDCVKIYGGAQHYFIPDSLLGRQFFCCCCLLLVRIVRPAHARLFQVHIATASKLTQSCSIMKHHQVRRAVLRLGSHLAAAGMQQR